MIFLFTHFHPFLSVLLLLVCTYLNLYYFIYMEKCQDFDTIIFVNKIKTRLNDILDGRKSRLDKSSQYLKYLGYLSDISISYEILKQTRIGQTLRLLRKVGGEIGQLSKDLVSRWKRELNDLDNSTKKDSVNDSNSIADTFVDQNSHSSEINHDRNVYNFKHLSQFQQEKLWTNDINIDITSVPSPLPLPSNTPHLINMPSLPEIILPELQTKNNIKILETKSTRRVRLPSNSFQQFISSNSRTKVYSGVTSFKANIFSLSELCIRSLEANIHLIDKISIGFLVLRPLLERIIPLDLARIEFINPYLQQSTGYIWERICHRNFKVDTFISSEENWKGCYFKHMKEKDEKLRSLSSKITAKRAGLKPSSSVISLNIKKIPRKNISRKVFRKLKDDETKFTPLMKQTIQQFKERKQMYKSKPLK